VPRCRGRCPHPKLAAIPAPCAPQALSFPSSDAASPACRASPAPGRTVHVVAQGTPRRVFVEQARANGVWTHMYEVLHARAALLAAGVLPTFGPWRHVRIADARRCDSPEAIEQAYLLAAKGQFTQGARAWRAWSSWPGSGHVCCRLPRDRPQGPSRMGCGSAPARWEVTASISSFMVGGFTREPLRDAEGMTTGTRLARSATLTSAAISPAGFSSVSSTRTGGTGSRARSNPLHPPSPPPSMTQPCWFSPQLHAVAVTGEG